MVKKTKTIEVECCDNCGTDPAYNKCMGCGLVFCYDCDKIKLHAYPYSLYFQGSDDGKFCHKCDENPPEKIQILHSLYHRMKMLQKERVAFIEKTDAEGKEIEMGIKQLIE